MPFLPYSRQVIDKADIDAVAKVLCSDFLTQGPTIEVFENKLADAVGSKYAVVLNSGTAALHAAYFSLGLTKNDEFITSPMTFAATANAGLYLQAKPVFADIDPKTGNINPDTIEALINKKTRMIVPVHFGGNPVDLEKLHVIAQKHSLAIVEDACHALGAEFQGASIGACKYSDITVFSFHAVKHITTGEGGAITTNSKTVYEKALLFRTHGITKEKSKMSNTEGDWFNEMQYLGFNYRMTDIQAALGISQLQKLDAFVAKRRKIAQIYDRAFAQNPYFDTIPQNNNGLSSYHLYPILLNQKYIPKRKAIFDSLRKKNLWVQVHYIPVYRHPYYQQLGYKKGLCPNAEEFYTREISIPIYSSMSNGDVKRVIDSVLNCF
jgi:UDP-4-amino-4,6-dideoxy-N-acetyl-beta-L-altrosamine transaminase